MSRNNRKFKLSFVFPLQESTLQGFKFYQNSWAEIKALPWLKSALKSPLTLSIFILTDLHHIWHACHLGPWVTAHRFWDESENFEFSIIFIYTILSLSDENEVCFCLIFIYFLLFSFISDNPNLYLKIKSMAKINSTLKSPWMSRHVYKHPLWLQHLLEVLTLSWVRHVLVPLFWLIMKLWWHSQQGMEWIDWHRSTGTDLVVWQDNLQHWKCLLVIMLSQVGNRKFLCLTYSRNDLSYLLLFLFLWNHLNTVHMLNTFVEYEYDVRNITIDFVISTGIYHNRKMITEKSTPEWITYYCKVEKKKKAHTHTHKSKAHGRQGPGPWFNIKMSS